ncbi:MAG: hypothetical protein IJ491_01830 [Clostridia bacterium]|nr:hypothetical protein [Clostridia bacterium]
MQKKLNLVLLSLKMVLLGYLTDGINLFMWKSAVKPGRKDYRLLSLSDKVLYLLRDEFQKTETVYLSIYELSKRKAVVKE